MRYSAVQKAKTRENLLKVTGSLAKLDGFSASGVDALAQAAGLTSGAFYNHFPSKSALFAALVANELEHSIDMCADGKSDHPDEEWMLRQVRRYLSWRHVQSPESGCALPSLGVEIARADKQTRKVCETALARLHSIWTEKLGDEDMAWAVMSQMIGTIMLSRMMASERAGKEVLTGSRQFLEKLLLEAGSR